jgi:RNA polymerase sigma factor (TIGR02999 family)
MARDVTQLLIAWTEGDQKALEALMPVVYEELRRLARSYMQRERADHSLGGTVLVHEAYLRLVNQKEVRWENRAQFFGMASQLIRNILVDHARRKGRLKRGGDVYKLAIDEGVDVAGDRELDLVQLDDALNALAELDERQARIVELRFFTGLSIEDTAAAMGISPATVKREWVSARAWLYRELARGATSAPHGA